MSSCFLNEIEGCKELLSGTSPVADGKYIITCNKQQTVLADSSHVSAKVWFKTPSLGLDIIGRIDRIQLLAECYDQGAAKDPNSGNWTWFELAIFENETAVSPRVKDSVELVWRSHDNRFLTSDYGWSKGLGFDRSHHLLRLLEGGNVVAVRLCARFQGWKIHARRGYLSIDVGSDKVKRQPPPDYSESISIYKNIQEVLNELNKANGANEANQSRSGRSLSTKAPASSPKPSMICADMLSTGGEPPLLVLSLDGGGVRGLSSLRLLKEVMEKAAPCQKPCEVFDMIAGTSTGGLIAIMLGRLMMTIDECIETYERLMAKAFPRGWFGDFGKIVYGLANEKSGYDVKPLEDAIKNLVRKYLNVDDAELYEKGGNPKCKVFVTAINQTAGNNQGPIIFRSYQNKQEKSLLPNIKIWEAARATCAAPFYFPPLEVDNYTFVDGGLGANNPVGWLWGEVTNVFGIVRPTSCVLSLGTGIPPNQKFLAPAFIDPSHRTEASISSVATNSEVMSILFRMLLNAYATPQLKTKYWRLNVNERRSNSQDYAEIGGIDDVKALKPFTKMAGRYVDDKDEYVKAITVALRERQDRANDKLWGTSGTASNQRERRVLETSTRNGESRPGGDPECSNKCKPKGGVKPKLKDHVEVMADGPELEDNAGGGSAPEPEDDCAQPTANEPELEDNAGGGSAPEPEDDCAQPTANEPELEDNAGGGSAPDPENDGACNGPSEYIDN